MTKHASKINPGCSRKDMMGARDQLHKAVAVLWYGCDCEPIGCQDCAFNLSTVRVDRRCLGSLLSEIERRLDEIIRTLEEEG